MAVTTEDKAAGTRSHKRILEDPEFKRLTASRNAISLTLTVLTLLTYYGFIGLLAYGKSILATKVTTNITLGIPIGVAVILIACFFTFSYAAWANRNYDHKVDQIKNRIGG